MSERLTPEQIEQMLEDQHDGGFTSSPSISEFVNELADAGYVIVHPDDVPTLTHAPAFDSDADTWHVNGWNDCRRHIFGDTP